MQSLSNAILANICLRHSIASSVVLLMFGDHALHQTPAERACDEQRRREATSYLTGSCRAYIAMRTYVSRKSQSAEDGEQRVTRRRGRTCRVCQGSVDKNIKTLFQRHHPRTQRGFHIQVHIHSFFFCCYTRRDECELAIDATVALRNAIPFFSLVFFFPSSNSLRECAYIPHMNLARISYMHMRCSRREGHDSRVEHTYAHIYLSMHPQLSRASAPGFRRCSCASAAFYSCALFLLPPPSSSSSFLPPPSSFPLPPSSLLPPSSSSPPLDHGREGGKSPLAPIASQLPPPPPRRPRPRPKEMRSLAAFGTQGASAGGNPLFPPLPLRSLKILASLSWRALLPPPA